MSLYLIVFFDYSNACCKFETKKNYIYFVKQIKIDYWFSLIAVELYFE